MDDVQAAESFDGPRQHAFDIVRFADVSGIADGPDPEPFELADRRRQMFLTATRNRHVTSDRSQCHGNPATDAGAAARDERHVAGKEVRAEGEGHRALGSGPAYIFIDGAG